MTWAYFRRLISQHFDVEELRTLCFDLNVDYDALRGEGKEAKVRELAALFRRNGRFPELIDALTNIRPHVNWSEITPSSADGHWAVTQRPLIWYALGIIVLLAGAFLIYQSRQPGANQRQTMLNLNDSGDLSQVATAITATAVNTTMDETAVTGQLIFSRYPLDNSNQVEICIWTAVTKQLECLKLAGRFPVWSPDGTQILFTHQGTNGPSRIYTAAADGSDFQELPIPDSYKNPREPDWSPDGQRLIFMAGEAESTDLYIFNLQNNQINPVTTNPNYDFNPDWSPASLLPGKILCASWYGDIPRQGIFSLTADAPAPEETRQLLFDTASVAETVAKPIWSPTENTFAFILENTQTAICTMNAVFGEEPECHDAVVDYQGMTWSPNGRYIAYTTQDKNSTQILLLEPSTGEIFTLLDQENHRIAGLSWKAQ